MTKGRRISTQICAGLMIALPVAANVFQASAESGRSFSGAYRCQYGCRFTDAAPSLEIAGNVARCVNELGGLYVGRVLGRNAIWCFNKRGSLSASGQTIRWSDGVVWKRQGPS